MKNVIDIDIGGTFTDILLQRDGRFHAGKSPTTAHDLSLGFMRGIEDVAERIGVEVSEVLRDTEVIRYSSTVAMNTLLQRKGLRLGLILTEGFEDTVVIGQASQWADGLSPREQRDLPHLTKPVPLVPRTMTIGAKERVDYRGRVIRPLDEEDLREKLRLLVDGGAKGFVVCLLWSFRNPIHEQRIEKIIREEYPDSYLGNVPVFLSSKVLPRQYEYQRSMATILNAYLHRAMAEELCGIGDQLRDLGYHKPMMMVHNTGGMAEVFRTTALQTFNGGPVAGVVGAAHVGQTLGYPNVVFTDMGGTSFDLGVVVAGSTRFYAHRPVIDCWRVNTTLIEAKSIGAGGGSVAWINPVGNRLEVGPQSAGAMPGPACYDMGGRLPTVTDADVVLGYINPDFYHGGRVQLNKERAVAAIREHIASPLGLTVDEAAAAIKRTVDWTMGDTIYRETVLRGHDPSQYVLLASGGAGATHCCGYGFRAGIPKIITTAFSPVFCAYGSSTMDIVQIYEQSMRIMLLQPGTMARTDDYESFNTVVRELRERAAHEIQLQGFPVDAIVWELELDMRYGGPLDTLRIRSPRLYLESEDDVDNVYRTFEREYAEVYSSLAAFPQGGVSIENFCLRARVLTDKPPFTAFVLQGPDPAPVALKGERPAYWEEYGGFRATPVYDQEQLACGNVIEGPAIIEAGDTTLVLPPGARFTLNQNRCGEIVRL